MLHLAGEFCAGFARGRRVGSLSSQQNTAAMMMMMMMKLPILPCAEKLELVLSIAPKHEITPTKTVKTENGPISRISQSEVSMVRVSDCGE